MLQDRKILNVDYLINLNHIFLFMVLRHLIVIIAITEGSIC